MDDAETAREIVGLALSQLDLNQVVRKGLKASDAEALGKKLGNFYYAFYQGVLAGLTEARQMAIPDIDDAKLEDAVYTKAHKGSPVKSTGRKIPTLKQSKLNDVVLFRGSGAKKPRS